MVPAAVVFVVALSTRLAHLDAPPGFDELYHLLAARGWLETGEFRIADGSYQRASLYTLFTAQIFALLGEDLAAARAASAVFGSLVIVVTFVWVDAKAGRVAAILAAALGILYPTGIGVAQFNRFYALHGLLFMLFSLGAYRLCSGNLSARHGLLIAAGAGTSFALALHLQPITLIGLVGLAGWMTLFVLLPQIWKHPQRSWILLGLCSAVVLAAAVAQHLGLLAAIWANFRFAPGWVEERQDDILFYHMRFLLHYPMLWSLFPLAVLTAVAARPIPALFCATVFSIGFAIHSLGGMKHDRYLYYLSPFLFTVWGIAGASVWWVAVDALSKTSRLALARAEARFASPVPARLLAGTVAVLLVVGGNPGIPYALALATGLTSGRNDTNWGAARSVLEPVLERNLLLATTDELKALYYFGRYDVAISWSRLTEIPNDEEFGVDSRTGKPVVSDPAAMARMIGCAREGLFLTARHEAHRERDNQAFADAMAAHPEAAFQEIALPEAAGLVAIRWSNAVAGSAECDGVSGASPDAPVPDP